MSIARASSGAAVGGLGFASVIGSVVAALTDAGIEASADPRRVNPPGVLVVPDAVVPFTKLCRVDQVRLLLILVARDSGDDTAYGALEALYTAVLATEVNPFLNATEATFERRVLPDSPTALPALRLTATLPI